MKKTFLALALVGALFTGAFAQVITKETNVLMADHKIMELGEKYLALLSSMYPEEATRLGTGIYHDQLLQRDRESQMRRGKAVEALQRTLQDINPKDLSVQRRMQYYTLSEQVNKKVFEEKTLDQLNQDPMWYMESLSSVYDIMEKEYASKEDRMRDIIKRIDALPQILEQGKENLRNAPDLRLRLAAQKTQEAYLTFDTIYESLDNMAKAEQTKVKIKEVCTKAKEALKNYYEFLKLTLETKNYTDFRLGEENYLSLIKDIHFVNGTIPQHTQFVENELAARKRVLIDLLTPYVLEILNEEEQVQRTDDLGNMLVLPSDYYVVKNVKFASAPELENIGQTYADTYQEAAKYFTEKEIIDMPTVALALKNNPKYLRTPNTLSYYLAPYPFAPKKTSDLLLNMPEEENQDVLSKPFTYSDIKIDVAQKLIPGISLSYNATADEQQVLINVSDDMFYLNGWNAYALRIAQEQGYFDDEADLLNIAWLNYKRALYALADIKMQTKELNYTQTLDMLISAGINDEEATAQVDYMAVNPAQALSYLLGEREFERVNAKFKKKLKNKFDQKEFIKKVLSLGRVPLNVLEEGIENSYKTKADNGLFNMTYF